MVRGAGRVKHYRNEDGLSRKAQKKLKEKLARNPKPKVNYKLSDSFSGPNATPREVNRPPWRTRSIDVDGDVLAYSEYIQSTAWDRRRHEYFTKHGRACACCGAHAQELHHLTYDRIGRELDDDLMGLCKSCHQDVTREHIATGRQDLRAATKRILRLHKRTGKH